MSQDLAPPPPAREKPAKRQRVLPWLSPKPETRSVQIGVLATIFIHLILLMLAPRLLDLSSAGSAAHKVQKPPLDIDLSQMILPPPKPPPKPPMKFVEANPNAPENIPDKTNNFSDRNQQVAQLKPTPVTKQSDMPALTGRKDIDSTQIVDGHLAKPQESVPVSAPTPTAQKPPSTAAPRREENPLPGFEKMQGSAPDGFATNTSKNADNAKPIPQKVDGSKDAPLLENATASTPQIDPKHPQPRRVLDQNVRPAIFKQNDFGTANIGPTAVDARWSNYGVYLKKMIETVQIEWDSILEDSRIYPNPGSTVSIKFVMNSKGEITSIVHVESSSGTSDAAQHACATAITARAPYGDWTDDMIAVLGTEQEMTFTFYYQ